MSYEASVPALTPPTASLAESLVDVWPGQNRGKGCPWKGARAKF